MNFVLTCSVQISLHNGQRNPISKDHLIQVHMSFISKQAAYIVDEAVLRGIFAAFGEVADISIKKHAFMMVRLYYNNNNNLNESILLF